MNNVTLGILGGLGPMSGVLFCKLLTEHTKAEKDQQHLNFLLSSRADTPDRTDFILGDSGDDPAPVMIEEVRKLTAAGADVIAIPCNTAHYFYDRVSSVSTVPIINIVEETVRFCKAQGYKRVGVLSTKGTALSGAYRSVFEKEGIEHIPCDDTEQDYISDVIYNNIKKGTLPEKEKFISVCQGLYDRGCETIVLGCTELSILKAGFELDVGFVDSLDVLALIALRLCNKEPCGFSAPLMNYCPDTVTNKEKE